MAEYNHKSFEFQLLMAVKNWFIDKNCVSIDFDSFNTQSFLKDFWVLYDQLQINTDTQNTTGKKIPLL